MKQVNYCHETDNSVWGLGMSRPRVAEGVSRRRIQIDRVRLRLTMPTSAWNLLSTWPPHLVWNAGGPVRTRITRSVQIADERQDDEGVKPWSAPIQTRAV